jgi:aspartate kinase/aspartokinase/homoserine dehydrogenase 1
MSDKIIRLGGSHIGDTDSIKKLNHFLGKSEGRKIIVVSAIPQLLLFIEQNLNDIFVQKNNSDLLVEKLNLFFIERAGGEISDAYKQQVEQLAGLLRGIALIGNYSASLKDQILSFAEKLSTEILKAQWYDLISEIEIIQPEDIELEVTPDFGNSTYISVNIEKIKVLPKSVFFIPGSYGITEKGKVARTGRLAADYTAAFLTSSLNVNRLELWDLDNDFQRADPRIVSAPPTINRLTYSEASELAYFEHYSFHPRTVEPLESRHIPIEILCSLTSEGTVKTTINTETFIERQVVKSIACTDDISLLKLDGPGVGLKPGIIAKVTTKLNDAGINIKSIITSQTSINIVLEKSTGDTALGLIQELGFSSVKDFFIKKDVSLIGIVGHGMQANYDVSAKIFSAVAANKINVVLSGSGASDLVSYLVVRSVDKEKSVRVIYNAFYKAHSNLPKGKGLEKA